MSVLLAGIAALALLEVLVNLVVRPQSGPFALAAVFEPHLLVIGAACGLVAIILTLSDRDARASRIRVIGVAVLVVALVRVGGEWWSPDDGPNPAVATGDATRISVMSWNLEAGSKAPQAVIDGILDAPRSAAPDIVVLQELTRATSAAIDGSPEIDAAYPYRVLEPRDGALGMGILSSLPLVKGSYGAFPMLLTAQVLLEHGERLDLLDAHPFPPRIATAGPVPWGIDTRQRDRELESLHQSVGALADRRLAILAGDLNTTASEPGFSIVADGLTDAHGQIGTGTGFTWRPAFLEPLQAGLIRIDHVLSGPGLLPVTSHEDCSLPGDHCRLTVVLELAPQS